MSWFLCVIWNQRQVFKMDIQKIPEISLAITGVQFSSRRTVFEGTNLSIKPCAKPTQSILASSLSTISSRMDPWLLNLVLCKCTITYPSVRSEVGRISCEGKSLLKFFHVMTFYRNSNNNLYSLQHIFALSTIVLTRKEAATTVSRNTNRGGQAQIK